NSRLTREDTVVWQKRLAEKGWAAPNWPVEYGGAGFTPTQNYIWDLERARVGAPKALAFGVGMVAPVIMKFGTQQQKEFFLPAILNSDIWFCQGYSEPGSGSDLASLSTKAESHGDHYLVNGVKTWTTLAQHADWIFCLVRTSHEEKRQLGISFLLIDMRSEGVDVRPLITIDQPESPNHEINMVYLQDVKVPKENLVGTEGQGWTCAKYLLEFERGNAYSPSLAAAMSNLRNFAKSEEDGNGGMLWDDVGFRRRFLAVEVEILALEATELRILSALAAGQNVGPESSLLKTRGTELQQAVSELGLEISGTYALGLNRHMLDAIETNEPIGPPEAAGSAQHYFSQRKVSIYAGSNEIQRNIMAKLVLGL
ncbi:MAG: pimeloyl-CoA dehydrogenase large subunit, partial [Chromatiales bacterium]|nr:pimeloyl-CoA dehydrogenase large subunit [Chromatiales bacterium]